MRALGATTLPEREVCEASSFDKDFRAGVSKDCIPGIIAIPGSGARARQLDDAGIEVELIDCGRLIVDIYQSKVGPV
jgi:hypothetical protein